jgi:hypothetical protein
VDERRVEKRFPLAMKAFPLGGTAETVLESDNVSTSGAYFVGDPGMPSGAALWIRLELGTLQRGRESVYPLCAQVRIARLSRSGDGSVAGFGAEWLAAWSPDDPTPLKEFLRRTLSLSTGYIQTIPPTADGRTAFLYVFPAGEAPAVAGPTVYEQQADPVGAGASASTPAALEKIGLDEPLDLDFKTPLPMDGRAGAAVYTAVPLTWATDEGEFEGRAIKLFGTGLRVACSGEVPGAYRRIVLRIPIRQRDRSGTLALNGTVVTQRPGRSEGEEHQFEVQLTLGNDPDSLHLYRKLLDRLASLSAPVGA